MRTRRLTASTAVPVALAVLGLGVAAYGAWICSLVVGYVLGVSPIVPLALVVALATGVLVSVLVRIR